MHWHTWHNLSPDTCFKWTFIVAACIMESIYCSLTNKCTFYYNCKSLNLNENTHNYSSYTAVAQWLRCCATNQKVAGSIPDGVNWHNPLDRTMALGSTQPLRKMITGEFPGGKCGWCVRLTTLPPPCVVMKSGNLNFLEPSGPLLACKGTDL